MDGISVGTGNPELNDIVLKLIQDNSLKQVLQAAEIACERMAHFAADSPTAFDAEEERRWTYEAQMIKGVIKDVIHD